jgi:4-hydroxybenzoyl-CoA reductase alpha subunit
MPDELQFVGRSMPRVDARVKVTGEARYTVDLTFPNMLWGRLLRSPLPHARIMHIDTRRAERLIGVKAVLTGVDTPFTYGVSHMDQMPLQRDKVRHIGDPVAAVAAIDQDIAQEALDLIKVDYEELPAVFHPEEAMEPGSPVIHEGIERNIVARPSYKSGNMEKAFSDADHVFEDRFETQRVAHVCPETHNCVAFWDHSGKLYFYVSSQMPSAVRLQLSKAFNIPESKIRVITNHVGGGFGSKTVARLPIEFCAILLARKTGRPVKMVHTREEEFIYSTFRHRFIVKVKTGIKVDGTITGRHFTVICECGAYTGHGASVTSIAGALQGVLYRYKNYCYDGYAVYTNTPHGGTFRGVGNPQVHFAGETQLNMIAVRLGLDPLELRLKNATRTGDRTATGALVKSCGLSECLQKAAENIGWKEKRANPEQNMGIGLSCAVHFTGIRLPGMRDADFAGATIIVNDDGSVNLATSSVDIGQGSATVLTQIAAEALGIEMEKINITYGDTETCPMGGGTRASRTTAIGGMAVKRVAEAARKQILQAASERWGDVKPDALDIRNSKIYVKSRPKKSMSVADVVQYNRYRKDGQAIMAMTHWDAPSHGNISSTFSFGAKIVEVEVDPGTGQVRVLDIVAANDLGKAINPMGAMGQIAGGAVQGLGMAMSEEIIFDEMGRVINNQFLDYRVLTALDTPPIRPILVESNDPVGPFGAKGVAEMALIGVPDAFSSAVHDAAGVWIKTLPITPEKVLWALREKKAGQNEPLDRP